MCKRIRPIIDFPLDRKFGIIYGRILAPRVMPVDVIYTINRRGNRFHRTDEYAGLYRHNGSLRRLYGQDYKRRGHEGHIKRGDGSGKKGPRTGDLYNRSYKAFC
jgi:hypothetical protein